MNLRRILDPLNTTANFLELARCIDEYNWGGYAKHTGIVIAKQLCLSVATAAGFIGTELIVEKIKKTRNKQSY